jgi:hypothetical protein
VVEGKADIAFAIPTAESIVKAERNPHGIRWIDLNPNIDPDGARRFWKVKPLITFGQIFSGVPSSIGHWGTTGTSLYITREQNNPDFIYLLAKWLDLNFPRFKNLHQWNRLMSREVLVDELKRTFVPCHEGLKRYLIELGIWTPAWEIRQVENARLIDRYCAAYTDAVKEADYKGIVIEPKSTAWVELWGNTKKKLGLPAFRVFQSL